MSFLGGHCKSCRQGCRPWPDSAHSSSLGQMGLLSSGSQVSHLPARQARVLYTTAGQRLEGPDRKRKRSFEAYSVNRSAITFSFYWPMQVRGPGHIEKKEKGISWFTIIHSHITNGPRVGPSGVVATFAIYHNLVHDCSQRY